jgi:hypothetical protein
LLFVFFMTGILTGVRWTLHFLVFLIEVADYLFHMFSYSLFLDQMSFMNGKTHYLF